MLLIFVSIIYLIEAIIANAISSWLKILLLIQKKDYKIELFEELSIYYYYFYHFQWHFIFVLKPYIYTGPEGLGLTNGYTEKNYQIGWGNIYNV